MGTLRTELSSVRKWPIAFCTSRPEQGGAWKKEGNFTSEAYGTIIETNALIIVTFSPIALLELSWHLSLEPFGQYLSGTESPWKVFWARPHDSQIRGPGIARHLPLARRPNLLQRCRTPKPTSRIAENRFRIAMGNRILSPCTLPSTLPNRTTPHRTIPNRSILDSPHRSIQCHYPEKRGI